MALGSASEVDTILDIDLDGFGTTSPGAIGVVRRSVLSGWALPLPA